MVVLFVNYFDMNTLSKQNTKSQFQSHLSIITATILQCKELSNIMPIQADGSLADATLLDTLECNTSTPYELDGDRGAFIPEPLRGFTNYKATQNTSAFYFTTTTELNSNNYKVLQELKDIYSTKQYQLTDDGSTATLNFYLSR